MVEAMKKQFIRLLLSVGRLFVQFSFFLLFSAWPEYHVMYLDSISMDLRCKTLQILNRSAVLYFFLFKVGLNPLLHRLFLDQDIIFYFR